MAKKHWIYVKRGLSEDPKHRAQMGECIWLYLHIIDRADWETGIAYNWIDEEEANDMGMPLDTLRHQRQKLDKLDYIRCFQKQHNQDIYIMEWRNPRDYGNEVKNPRVQGSLFQPPSQGGNVQPPSEFQGSNQGSNQGTSQSATPTSTSESKDSRKKRSRDPVDGIIRYHVQPKAVQRAIAEHFKLTPNWETKFSSQFMEWVVEAEVQPAQIETAAKTWRQDKRFNWSVPTLKGIQEHWLELLYPGASGSTAQTAPELSTAEAEAVRAQWAKEMAPIIEETNK